MKTNFKLFFALLPFLSMIIACSEEDSDSFMPSASDINVTIDENPNSGESIGTVATNLTGTLVYSISSQSAENAFSINSSTGEVRINDASKFNFEDMMTLEANVSVTNSEQNANSMVTVSLNDIDDIWYYLSSSRDAYMAAETDSWIQITGSEYERLAENLSDISRVGTSNEEFNASTSILNLGSNVTFANDNGQVIPANNYVFAFNIYSWSNNAASSSVKISNGSSTGPFMPLGENLPEYDAGNQHFVFKGANTPTTSEAYLGLYGSVAVGGKPQPTSVYKYGFGNQENLNWADGGFVVLYQGLSTGVKQWD